MPNETLHTGEFVLMQKDSVITLSVDAVGNECSGAGLQASSSHGLPCSAAPAHAGVLGEGAEHEAALRTDRQHTRQAPPQRREPQSAYQHTLRVSSTQARLDMGQLWL